MSAFFCRAAQVKANYSFVLSRLVERWRLRMIQSSTKYTFCHLYCCYIFLFFIISIAYLISMSNYNLYDYVYICMYVRIRTCLWGLIYFQI